MRRSPHHLSSRPSTDSSTAPLLGDNDKGNKSSGRHREKIYAIGSGRRHQATSTSGKKEEKPHNSEDSYRRIKTSDQKAHEEEQESSKGKKYLLDPVTLLRCKSHRSDIRSKIRLTQRSMEIEERESITGRNPWEHWKGYIDRLEELHKKILELEKAGYSPRKANRELDKLLESNKDLFAP
ncbi:uncharacterized protein EAE97_004391 [Botrytis byssoidea]|uniref:Uncharacterized protein n=1 Tax=Botrytis byssoidea TaxID=139641 RepID=A0A9P5IQ98_9HELO|nr:uncharacterized protein EAE97_004391 [Botrytis byssoidea]KAF7947142.1 hypothetical protein EAE97_004391 [Botrytis byssoidea]